MVWVLGPVWHSSNGQSALELPDGLAKTVRSASRSEAFFAQSCFMSPFFQRFQIGIMVWKFSMTSPVSFSFYLSQYTSCPHSCLNICFPEDPIDIYYLYWLFTWFLSKSNFSEHYLISLFLILSLESSQPFPAHRFPTPDTCFSSKVHLIWVNGTARYSVAFTFVFHILVLDPLRTVLEGGRILCEIGISQ